MDSVQADYQSHLFTMRIWSEELGDGQTEWRGQVQHALSGETGYFREWPALIAWLLATLPQVDAAPPQL